MKIYLDTGNSADINELVDTGLIDGITTNPSLIAKEKVDLFTRVKEIISILNKEKENFTISVEVIKTHSVEEILNQAREIVKLDKHILVKIPLTYEGLKAVKILSKEGIRCNVTLCFSLNQALLAAKAGAYVVSPFMGRIDDEGWDGLELVKEIKQAYINYNFETKILAASVRSTYQVHQCALMGIDIVTISPKIFKQLYYNPLTEIGLEKFAKDWQEANK